MATPFFTPQSSLGELLLRAVAPRIAPSSSSALLTTFACFTGWRNTAYSSVCGAKTVLWSCEFVEFEFVDFELMDFEWRADPTSTVHS